MINRFKKTTEKLRKLNGYAMSVMSIQGSAAGIPAFSQVGNAFMILGESLLTSIMEPLIEELTDLQSNNGPQAQFLRRMNRMVPQHLGKTDVDTDDVASYIKQQYPHQYPDREQEGGLARMVQGLIPNIEGNSGVYPSQYGENTINVYPFDDAFIKLAQNWAAAEKGVVKFEDGVTGIIATTAPTAPSGTGDDSRDWVVTLDYDNGCRVTFHYTGSGWGAIARETIAKLSFYSKRYVDYHFQELVNVLQNEIPSGQQYINPHHTTATNQRLPLQMACTVYNKFEDVTHPGTHDYITHEMLRKLMQEWLRVNAVETDQSSFEYLLDDKLRYKTLLSKIHELAHPGEVPMVVQGTVNTWMVVNNSYGNYTENYRFQENYVVNDLKDPTKREAFVIMFCETSRARYSNNYNVLFTFNDETETCKIEVYSLDQKRFVNPTPRTIEWLTEQMLKSREAWVIQERKNLNDVK